MVTWPRVRIIFAVIGMISTAIFLWDQLEWLLGEFVVFAEWVKGMMG